MTALAALPGCGSSGIKLGPGPNNSKLSGQYAFVFSGQNSNGFLTAAGSFTADGVGNITTGREDVNNGGGSLSITFVGKYSIGSDGRGTALLTTSNGPATWQFTMVNSDHALFIRFENSVTASGTIDRQNAAAFTLASLQGNYVFGFSGTGVIGGLATMAGRFGMDGLGGISGGEQDVNDFGVISQDVALSGSYTVGSDGRGSATLSSTFGTQNFVFYVVDATQLKFVESDAFPVVSGEVLRQVGGPFSLATLNGGHAFVLGGADPSNAAIAAGGVFSADGIGNLQSGLLDINHAGFPSLANSFTGTYSVSSSGRGVLSFLNFTLAFYPAASGTIELVEIDTNNVTSGFAKPQVGTPFGLTSMSGDYAINFAGTTSPAVAPAEEDLTGHIFSDGAGHLSGALDVNNSGNLFQAIPLSASTYSMSAEGRGNTVINTSPGTFNMQTYQVDSNTVLFLDVDSTRVLTGLAQKQF